MLRERESKESVYYIYPAARADEDEVDASSGSSDRAPRASKQSIM